MIRSFCSRIDFPGEAIACLEQAHAVISGSADAMVLVREAARQVFAGDTSKVFDMLQAVADQTGVHRYTTDMVFWIHCAQQLRELYREKGLSDEMFWDSMQDLRYKLTECHTYCGIWGTMANWFGPFFTLKRFGFGRLQYDKWTWPNPPYKNRFQTGDPMYRIHIPACGGPLTMDAVMDSFRGLHAFCHKDFPDGIVPIACVTWLLYPPMLSLFPEGGNTRAFANLFQMYEEKVTDSAIVFRWIFNMYYENPETLTRVPTDTRFRRAAKAYFEAGGRIGSGSGILLFDGKNILHP